MLAPKGFCYVYFLVCLIVATPCVLTFAPQWQAPGRRREQQQHKQLQQQHRLPLQRLEKFSILKFPCGIHMSSNPDSEDNKIKSVIYADEADFDFDVGQGGVRLAAETFLCLSGNVVFTKKTMTTEAKPNQFVRYNQVRPVTAQEVEDNLQRHRLGVIVAVGNGRELYQDPGDSTENIIELAPLQAAEDLLRTVSTGFDQSNNNNNEDGIEYVVNVVGGDDLQILELLNALALLRQGLIGNGKDQDNIKMIFNSMTHHSFPLQRATITLVRLTNTLAPEKKSSLQGVEKALSEGRVFFQDGNYYTLVEEDVNPNLS